MEELILVKEEGLTSVEFAKIAGKDHSNVIKAIKLINADYEKLNQVSANLVNYKDKKGEKRTMFQLSKEHCMDLAMRYDSITRIKVRMRLQELESKLLPKTFSEALQAAADAQRVIELQAPKIAVHDTITNSNKLSTISEVSALFDIGRTTMYKWLRRHSIVQLEMNKPYQKYIDSGHFDFKIETKNGRSYYTTLVTGKGIVLIGRMRSEDDED